MRITEVEVPLLEVEGFPQLRVKPPSISELVRLLDTMPKFDVAGGGDELAEALRWLFATFLRDERGDPLDGLDDPADCLAVSTSISRAVTSTLLPRVEADAPKG